ncbi:hypothetical protein Trydic_g21122 [Trypoxylus dichotomus]
MPIIQSYADRLSAFESNGGQHTTITIKHGGGNVMVWGCMPWRGVGPIYHIEGLMDQHQHIRVLKNVLVPYTDENLPITWSVEDAVIANSISVISWPVCTPDIKSIENLWYVVKKTVGEHYYSSLDKL